MFRIIRVPRSLDQFFRPLHHHFHWDHFEYFRVLVLGMAFTWGRHNVANLCRYLDIQHHRTRFNHFFLVQRWDPEAALQQKAQELLRALAPQAGDTVYLSLDDSKHAKRGKQMDAIAKLKDPTTDASLRGHPYVCGLLLVRQHVIPWGIRRLVKQEACAEVGMPFQQTTEFAAPLIRELQAPARVKVMVLFDAYSLCPTVVKAGRERRVHFAATRKSHRSLFKPGWKLKAGRYGRNQFRRHRTEPLVIAKPHGRARYRYVDAGWLQVSKLGGLHVVFSRTGVARKIRGLVTDDPDLSAAEVIRTYDKRWTIEQWGKDVKQRLGLGQYQNRSDGAAVTHLHLVAFASALLTHLRLARTGAPRQRTRDKAAGISTAAVQDQLRSLLWEDLITYLKEERPGQPVIQELERLRVA
jgi:DDE superfamily endonuclease